MKISEYPDIEVSLLIWFIQCRDLNIPINGPILKEKVELFATKLRHKQFKASQGWLSNWKIRNYVVFRKICGETLVPNVKLLFQVIFLSCKNYTYFVF